ncbi:MAG: HD domain-containing protein [Acholeplasmatales bacterium]|nr:HD domain-containing protein [Acholeplasmatales bacterium]
MKNRRIIILSFVVSILLFISLLITSMIRVGIYNSKNYDDTFASEAFTDVADTSKRVSINVTLRDSWKKAFDFDNTGNTEQNYIGHTYDFTVSNNTKHTVDDFYFTVNFNSEAYVSSAWNGAIEFHQFSSGSEVVDTIPDLRSYDPEDYNLDIVTVESDNDYTLYLVKMAPGDYLVYLPSDSSKAMEMPIETKASTTPGINLFTRIDDDVTTAFTINLEYSLHRTITTDPLFWTSIIGMGIWIIVFVVVLFFSLQIRKYRLRHERDNVIINESIETFTGFIDAKDPYTNGHSKRVAIYTRLIAERMGFSGEELDNIYYIALLHDCGKIGVPDNILGKPGRLTDEEFEIIKSHTVRGGEILSRFKSLENAHEGALYHHERYDGRGYPKGLKGEEIPLIARMICVADSFDAMNSNRVYRKKISSDYIIDELKNNRGTQFDPKIADIMLELLEEGKIKFDDPDLL